MYVQVACMYTGNELEYLCFSPTWAWRTMYVTWGSDWRMWLCCLECISSLSISYILLLYCFRVHLHLASYQGSWWAGKERAWYPLFAHVLSFPEILGNRKLLFYICITVTTKRILTAKSSAHFLTNDGTFLIAPSPGLPSSLQWLGTSDMSPKKVQVATSSEFCLESTCLYTNCLVSLYGTLCYRLS